MKDEQPKAGHPNATNGWPLQDGSEQDNTIRQGANQAGNKSTDEAIAQDVEDQLNQDPTLDPEGLTLKVDSGEVTLQGYVAHLADKTRAEEIVRDIEGVSAFHNNLRIAPERH
jgi:osmotically-inducible protein OsmY